MLTYSYTGLLAGGNASVYRSVGWLCLLRLVGWLVGIGWLVGCVVGLLAVYRLV